MSRDVVIDGTIIDELNRGNSGVAKVLTHLSMTGTRLWMPMAEYATRPEADKRLVRDYGIQVPAINNSAAPPAIPAGVPANKAPVAQLAATLNGQVMSMDQGLVRAMPRQRVVANMLTIRERSGLPNYNQARRLLNLKPLNVTSDGKVIRMAPPQRGAPPMRIPSTTATAAPKQGAAPAPTTHGAPQVKVNGQSWGPRPAPTGSHGDMPGKAQTRQPDKVDPVANPPQNQKDIVDRHRQRATLAFQGVNYVIQAINNHIQQQRMQERWTKLEPSVRQALADEPTLGALVRVYYYRRQKVAQEKDSPMEHTNAFADIRIAYGMTREDALTNFEKQAQINAAGAGEVSIDDSMFIPPQLPVDYTKLKTPFQAEGVATFVPGREAFLHLQWAGPNRSFVRRGETKFTAPIKLPEAIRFLYLTPPSEIDYRENKFRFETQEIDWDYQDPGEKANAGSFGYRFPGVPALDTGSLLADTNIWNAQRERNPKLAKQRAVIVFPLNETTAKMFAAVNSLVDNNGELWNIPSFRKSIRFIHPERLRVLRYFGAE